MKRRDKNKIYKAQQKRVNRAFKNFQNKMQSIVNGKDIESISMQIGDGPKTKIENKTPRGVSHCGRK